MRESDERHWHCADKRILHDVTDDFDREARDGEVWDMGAMAGR